MPVKSSLVRQVCGARPFEAGFAISGLGLSASRKWSRTRSGFYATHEFALGLHGEQLSRRMAS
jgi:hypothetical protein